jgi:hypothetical protein
MEADKRRREKNEADRVTERGSRDEHESFERPNGTEVSEELIESTQEECEEIGADGGYGGAGFGKPPAKH